MGHLEVSPCGLLYGEPVAERFQAKFQEPLGFSLLLGDEAHDVLGESFLDDVCLYVGGEAVFVLLLRHFAYKAIVVCHSAICVLRGRALPKGLSIMWIMVNLFGPNG